MKTIISKAKHYPHPYNNFTPSALTNQKKTSLYKDFTQHFHIQLGHFIRFTQPFTSFRSFKIGKMQINLLFRSPCTNFVA